MKKILFALTVFLSFNGIAFSSLPPLWQNVAEINAMINDKELANHLTSGDVIQDIKKTDDGWIIVTNHNHLPVHIVYATMSQPGPARFNVVFDTPISN
jgi:hypothetical protein